jgi:glycosyltransferase involved in cell wall biosynthesis
MNFKPIRPYELPEYPQQKFFYPPCWKYSNTVRSTPRGIDVDHFHPRKRNGILRRLFPFENGLTMFCVGRVSRENNLHILADAFARLATQRRDVHLAVVGAAPYLAEMRRTMKPKWDSNLRLT